MILRAFKARKGMETLTRRAYVGNDKELPKIVG